MFGAQPWAAETEKATTALDNVRQALRRFARQGFTQLNAHDEQHVEVYCMLRASRSRVMGKDVVAALQKKEAELADGAEFSTTFNY